MKTITILTEHTTDRGLAAAIPTAGVASVSISRSGLQSATLAAAAGYRSFRSARFSPQCRIDLVVDDAAVDSVIDCVSFAYGAGFFGDAEVWIDASAMAA